MIKLKYLSLNNEKLNKKARKLNIYKLNSLKNLFLIYYFIFVISFIYINNYI